MAVDHVGSGGDADAPEEPAVLGHAVAVRVRVTLGELEPGEVEVQVVAGRVDADDTLTDPVTIPLKPVGGPDLEGRWTYEGELALDRTGPVGYTVRILPAHPLLASRAELGLLALPAAERSGGPLEAGVLLR